MAPASDTRMDGKGFSELVVERGFCKPKHIVEAVQEQSRLKQEEGIQRSLKEILLERGVLSPAQVEEIEAARRGARIVAGFEILAKVGQGAMGSVFKARQIALDRAVALKILDPKLAQDATFKERFLREARFSAKLNHLNVISGIDCGEESGCLYFAMEFVDGKTTGEILKEKGEFPIEEAVRILRQVVEGLQYAHSFDMVHRDVKPDNVMVDVTGTAKLCDLGLATLRRADRGDRWGDKDDENDGSATKAGRVVGTPFYIAPEQAKGSEGVDCRCDIYSLGATLYHWLTGRPPFEGRSYDVMRQHVSGEARSVCEVNSAVPVVLGQIVSKMMAKEPDERYADPAELMADLDAAVDGRPVTAADFKGRSSCAMPPRNLRRPPMPKPKRKPIQEILPGAKKARETVKEMEAAPPSLRAFRPRRARRSSGSVTGVIFLLLMIGAGVALYVYLSGQPIPPPPPQPPSGITPPSPPPGGGAPEQAKKGAETATKKVPEKPDAKIAPESPDGVNRSAGTPPKSEPSKTGTERAVGEIVQPVGEQDAALALLAGELAKRLSAGDLSQASAVLDELATRPSFASVKAEIEADRKDFAAARAYETAALKSIVASRRRNKKLVRLTESGRQKCENKDEATLEFFDPDRGVGASVDQTKVALQSWDLEPVDVVNKAEGVDDPVGRVCYLIARGRVSEARKRLPQLPVAARDRLEKKLNLLSEQEQGQEREAAAAFEELSKKAAAGNRADLRAALATFLASFGQTAVAQSNAAKLDEWKRKAEGPGLADFSRQFSVPPEQLPGGGYAFTWTAKEKESFEKDWAIDSPQGAARGFVTWKPDFGSLVGFRGRSGDFWDGKRKGAVVAALRENVDATHYRLEVTYSLGSSCGGGYIAGIGLWDGGERGLAFGPREARGGRLSVAGCPPGLEGNLDKDRLRTNILADRGQLAIEVNGGEWRFLSRRLEETQEEAWLEAYRMKGAAGAKPAIVPVTWATGTIDFIIQKVRLVILPAK